VAEPIAAAACETGVEVYHAESRGRELRVQVESPSGASVRACSEFSHALTARLDAADFLRRQYTLEVSTPGIERRLYQPQDYSKALYQNVRVLVRDGWVEGRLEAAGPTGITIKVQAPNAKRQMPAAEVPAPDLGVRTLDFGDVRELAFADIREAQIRVSDSELFARSPAERK
jgi:ribosome maturation factor RimP